MSRRCGDEAGVGAQRGRRGARMGGAAGDRDAEPRDALDAGDDAEVVALGGQDGALLDVQLDVRVRRREPLGLLAREPDPRELVADGRAARVGERERGVERDPARRDGAAQHVGVEPGALLLVGEEDDVERALRQDPALVERADDLDGPEDA
jgi:hypothetical protein